MTMYIEVDLNIGRRALFPGRPGSPGGSRRSVKMFLVPKGVAGIVLDSAVPDLFVTDAMVARYLEIDLRGSGSRRHST